MKINLKAIKAFFSKEGYSDKIVKKEMSDDDWKALSAAFQKEFDVDLMTALADAKKVPGLEKEQKDALEALFNAPAATNPTPEPVAADPTPEPTDPAPAEPEGEVNVAKEIKAMKKTIQAQDQTIKKLGEDPEPPAGIPIKAEKPKIMLCGPGTSETYLFGIPNPIFSLEKSWNRNAAKMQLRNDMYSSKEKKELQAMFDDYTETFAKRLEEVQMNGYLPAIMGASFDYTDLETDLGAYYRVRRMDAIITHLRQLDSIAKVFPVRYNVQDEEIITNSFEGMSFTQPYQSGKVFAGTFKFQPDKAKVKDVMFKFKFHDLKNLEREYIGYLNKEGSDPIKWSFIEWIMVQCSLIQFNEKEQRRIKGVRVEPTATKAAHFMYGSDGVLIMLDDRYETYNQVYKIDSLKTYTVSTLVDYVKTLVKTVYQLKGTLNGMVLCMNDIHVPDFLEAYREKYKGDTDFTGEKMEVKYFPLPKIIRIPNMSNIRYDMWIMPEGAIEIQENKPGEFYAYRFQLDMEEVYVMSYGKEGTFAFAGKKYTSKATLLAGKGRHTNIFMNHPVTELADGATTCDGTVNEMFQTVSNTGATAITDITGAVEGVLYKIINGHTTNDSTIAKAGKFSEITAAYTPTTVGDYIKVIYDPDGAKFYEYERCVGGTITKNAALVAQEYTD